MYVDIGSYVTECGSAVLNDLRYGHQFRQICWNEPVRDLLQEQKVQIAILFIGDEGFALNRNILGLFMDLT